jgi:hypothetical protein
MNKDQLRELAVWGMRRRLQETEVQLNEWRDEFPELFIGEGRIQLLAPLLRENGANAFEARVPHKPRPAPGETVGDRVLVFLEAHPGKHYRAVEIAAKIDAPRTQVSSQLTSLKRRRKAYQPEIGRWALRPNTKKAVAEAPSKPKGGRMKDPASVSGRVEKFLAENNSFHTPAEIREALHLKKKDVKAMTSALQTGKKKGVYEHSDFGRWRAAAAKAYEASQNGGASA